jgi:hypothetical protein
LFGDEEEEDATPKPSRAEQMAAAKAAKDAKKKVEKSQYVPQHLQHLTKRLCSGVYMHAA